MLLGGQDLPGLAAAAAPHRSIPAEGRLSRCCWSCLGDGAEVPGAERHCGAASTVGHSTAHISICGTTEGQVHPPHRHLPGTGGPCNKYKALSGLPRVAFGDLFRSRSWVLYLRVRRESGLFSLLPLPSPPAGAGTLVPLYQPRHPPSPPGRDFPLGSPHCTFTSSPLHITYNNNQGSAQWPPRGPTYPKFPAPNPPSSSCQSAAGHGTPGYCNSNVSSLLHHLDQIL